MYICRQLIPTTAFLVVSDARTMLKADIAVMKNVMCFACLTKTCFWFTAKWPLFSKCLLVCAFVCLCRVFLSRL